MESNTDSLCWEILIILHVLIILQYSQLCVCYKNTCNLEKLVTVNKTMLLPSTCAHKVADNSE